MRVVSGAQGCVCVCAAACKLFVHGHRAQGNATALSGLYSSASTKSRSSSSFCKIFPGCAVALLASDRQCLARSTASGPSIERKGARRRRRGGSACATASVMSSEPGSVMPFGGCSGAPPAASRRPHAAPPHRPCVAARVARGEQQLCERRLGPEEPRSRIQRSLVAQGERERVPGRDAHRTGGLALWRCEAQPDRWRSICTCQNCSTLPSPVGLRTAAEAAQGRWCRPGRCLAAAAWTERRRAVRGLPVLLGHEHRQSPTSAIREMATSPASETLSSCNWQEPSSAQRGGGSGEARRAVIAGRRRRWRAPRRARRRGASTFLAEVASKFAMRGALLVTPSVVVLRASACSSRCCPGAPPAPEPQHRVRWLGASGECKKNPTFMSETRARVPRPWSTAAASRSRRGGRRRVSARATQSTC